MYKIPKDDWRYGRECECGVTGAIHRRTRGPHHWNDCPMYDAPADTELATKWFERLDKNAKELWH